MDIAAELRHKYNLSYILKIVNIPSTTFYRYLAKLNKPDKDAEIKALISEIFYDHKCTYGSLRVTAELRSRGYLINHKKVYRLMHEMGLKSPVRRAKYKSYKGCIGKICGNLLLDKHVDTIKHYINVILKLAVSTKNGLQTLQNSILQAEKFIYQQLWNYITEK